MQTQSRETDITTPHTRLDAIPTMFFFWLSHYVAIQNLLSQGNPQYMRANSAEFGLDTQILEGLAEVSQKKNIWQHERR